MAPCSFILLLVLATLVAGLGAVAAYVRRSNAYLMREFEAARRATEELRAAVHLLEPGAAHLLVPYSTWTLGADTLSEVARLLTTVENPQVLECGSGFSTLVLARCCQAKGQGHVVCLEHAADWAQRVRSALEAAHLERWVTVISAPLTPVQVGSTAFEWYDMQVARSELLEGRFDVLLVDGPPDQAGTLTRYPALPLLSSVLARHATVILDDGDRASEREVAERWSAEFGLTKVLRPSRHGHWVFSHE